MPALKANFLVDLDSIPSPVLATFDDLLQLGSPPLELASIYSTQNISWRPLQWEWPFNIFAKLVPGIRNKAIRFK